MVHASKIVELQKKVDAVLSELTDAIKGYEIPNYETETSIEWREGHLVICMIGGFSMTGWIAQEWLKNNQSEDNKFEAPLEK